MFTGLAFETVRLGIKNIHRHKLRSFLTTLGIICGVGAVICMLSISEGASEAELALIRLLGTQNVIVQSVKPESDGSSSGSSRHSRMVSYGVVERDLERIRNIPHVQRVVPLREVAYEVRCGSRRSSVAVVGADPAFFSTVHVELSQGRFLTDVDNQQGAKVCLLGDDVRAALFAYEDPIGQTVIVRNEATGGAPYTVVGVLQRVATAGLPAKGIGERNINNDVYIPIDTAAMRYGDIRVKRVTGTTEWTRCEYSDVYVQVASLDEVMPVSEMVSRTLEFERRNLDFVVRVPLERLQIAENEKRRRQITLGCIAGISLLVGGIGIMNIMLATVTERTREIGIRRALGAKRKHITFQFLIEAIVLTTVGGIVGVLAGSSGAHLITWFVGWPTVIHAWTIFISFGLAVAVGLFFGAYPAASAAQLDPIDALRHE